MLLSRILSANQHHVYRIERVRFGVPLESVCVAHDDIPGPLLVMILKLNKEAPFKKDVFRAPGHQANMKKLIHFLQSGRLVNIDHYSVYTIASVLKKFLRKLPAGVFGPERERRLFQIIESRDADFRRREVQRVLCTLPSVTQHLLVLLFGTFRAVATSAAAANTGMTAEAIGVSVAPSFFQSCVADGSKFAKMEDVSRFKIATTIMKFLIDNFGVSDLFGRENYEYYARISGRVWRHEENWTFACRYPSNSPLGAVGAKRQLPAMTSSDECQSTPALCAQSEAALSEASANQATDDAYGRLSMSLEENVFKVDHHDHHLHHHQHHHLQHQSSANSQPASMVSVVLHAQPPSPSAAGESLTLDELRSQNRYAESTKSLTFLPIVHARQTQRMKTRSQWFLDNDNNATVAAATPASAAGERQPIRRTSSKEKRLVRRSSSKTKTAAVTADGECAHAYKPRI